MFSLEFFRVIKDVGCNRCCFGNLFEGSLVWCTAIMAAWGHAGMAAVPAEITEEKLQEKGKCIRCDVYALVITVSASSKHC